MLFYKRGGYTMSAFYGTVIGSSDTAATRRGTKDIRVSAQSWDGSVITRMWYNTGDKLMVEIQTADGSSAYGYTVFTGTYEEYGKRLKGGE